MSAGFVGGEADSSLPSYPGTPLPGEAARDRAARERLAAAIRENADQEPDAPLIGDAKLMHSRAEFASMVQERSAMLRAAGVGERSRVASLRVSPVDLVVDVFAAMGSGAAVMPLAATLTAWEQERVLAAVPVTHLLAPERTGSVVERRSADGFGQHGAATVQLTSGTTGRQSAALRPAAAIAAEAEAYRTCLDMRPAETVFCATPAHHAYAFGLCVVAATVAGVPVRYLPPDQPRTLLRLLAEAGGGLVPSVPPMLRLLAAALRPGTELGAARFLTAGMPVDARTVAIVNDRLGSPLGQVYGTTETGPICIEAPGSAAVAAGRQGRPAPGVEVRLAADEDGRDPDAARPISVRSPMAMVGYADGLGIERGPVGDGWFRTGDLGRWAEDGVAILGRVSTCINVAGAKVSPESVEAAVMAFPGVTACLAHPIADEAVGQRVSLLVAPQDVDVAGLEAFLRERLSPSHLPHRYRTRATLATTATGKVLRRQDGMEDA